MQSGSFRPSAAEFPHDNPRFNRGAMWIGSSLCWLAAPEPEVEVPVEEFEIAAAIEVAPEEAISITIDETLLVASEPAGPPVIEAATVVEAPIPAEALTSTATEAPTSTLTANATATATATAT